MFARNVSIKLKPNTFTEFNQIFEKEILPTLRKQNGFRDAIAYVSDDNVYVTSISLWETKEHADEYNTKTFPTVLKSMDKYLDGAPKVRLHTVIAATSLPVSTVAAA